MSAADPMTQAGAAAPAARGSQPDAETGLVGGAPVFDRGDLVYLAYLLLPFRWFVQLGRLAGWLEMIVHPGARGAVRHNLETAFGATRSPAELDTMTRQVFEYHQMRSLLVHVSSLMAVRGQLDKHFPLAGREHLDRALASGKSALLLSSHVNSVGGLLAIIQLRRLGYPVRVPMPDRRDVWALTPFRKLVHRIFRAPTVMESIGAFYAQFNVRPLVNALKGGTILLLVGDGWHSAGFVDVDFVGHTLPFTNGPLSLARLAGVPVVPLFATGTPDHLRFELEPPFVVERSGTTQADVETAVRRYIGRVEQRMLADIPSWQHWMVEDMFARLEAWRTLPLEERYAV